MEIFDVVGFSEVVLETECEVPIPSEVMNISYWADDPARVCCTPYEAPHAAIEQAASN